MRGGLFDLSIVPNSADLDPHFAQFQWVGEIERRYELWGQPGKLAVTGFLSRGRMGSFADAIAISRGDRRPGRHLSGAPLQQPRRRKRQLRATDHRRNSAYSRAPAIANGNIEPYEFTDIDRTAAAGVSLTGKQWGRPDDTVGLAGVVNGITKVHQQFLNAGGLGILVGDGMLPHPGPEQIIETYYALPVSFFKLTLDYQFIVNPGYNADRGPVSVVSAPVARAVLIAELRNPSPASRYAHCLIDTVGAASAG